MSRYRPKDLTKVNGDYIHLKTMREIRKPHLYDSNPVRRRKSVTELLTSPEARLRYLQQAVDVGFLGPRTVNDELNRALAELVFALGAQTVAKKLGVNPTSLYRSFSFTEKRQLRVDRVDQTLRLFGLRLDVVRIPDRFLSEAVDAPPKSRDGPLKCR